MFPYGFLLHTYRGLMLEHRKYTFYRVGMAMCSIAMLIVLTVCSQTTGYIP